MIAQGARSCSQRQPEKEASQPQALGKQGLRSGPSVSWIVRISRMRGGGSGHLINAARHQDANKRQRPKSLPPN
ncbi:hypothetical protein SBV1_3480001 [Verrucomicrobia bacterium]|nr:hypothetical protein SBV1_3480001 [Verrucomicrobiota bacterium]